MFKLVPTWAYNYQEFWDSIRNRNLWLIHLRFSAVLMLLVIFLTSLYLLNVEFSRIQYRAFIVITIAITTYNLFLYFIRSRLTCTPGKFNPLHFSLLQIVLDLISLILLVHFTGTIETPLYMLFIFHMIIGSLILPRSVIFLIATIVLMVFTSMVAFEYYDIITHHHITALHLDEHSKNFNYIISSLGIFIFTIYTSVFITSRIVGKLYKREKQLKETLEQLNEAEKSKQKYIMGVVHEIKTPIAAAQSMIEIIRNGYVSEIDDKVKSKLDRAKIRNDEAITLINNILRISKLKLLGEVVQEEVDIIKVLRKIVEDRKELLSQKNIDLNYEDGTTIKPIVKGDEVLYELIFSNILGNSIKYSEENSRIEILVDKTKNNLLIEFSDRGIGIPKEDLEKIASQFYRASNITSGKFEGSGLGLSLVKEILEKLNGSMKISSPSKIGSEKFPGTTVNIKIPFSEIKLEQK
ncbi:MAG: HAMP domain-containing sensor histidine kinase [Melioribacteraceae bacterium]